MERRPRHLEERPEQFFRRFGCEGGEVVPPQDPERDERALEVVERVQVATVPGRSRAQDPNRLALELACEEMEERQRRCVGPVEVFGHDEERVPLRQALQKLGKAPEEAGPRFARIPTLQPVSDAAQRREELPEIAGRAAGEHRERGFVEFLEDREESVREEVVGHARLDRVRSPVGHRPTPPGRFLRQRAGHPGLAHPRISSEEHHRLHPGLVTEEPVEALELVLSPDQGELPGKLRCPVRRLRCHVRLPGWGGR